MLERYTVEAHFTLLLPAWVRHGNTVTTQPDDAIKPEGVDLTSWDDFPAHRQAIFDSIKTSVDKKFPQVYNGTRLELHDTHYVDPETYSLAEQKKALLQDKFLHRRLRGTYRLYDDKTNELLDEREATVLRAPYLTDRGTFLHNGNEITTTAQARLLPGVYTRRKQNGEVENHFNARRGTGSSFRVRLEPESGLFKVDIGQSSLRLYSLLKDLGVKDEDLEKSWGADLLNSNRAAYDSRVFEKAYQRLVRRPDPNATRDDKATAIRSALAATKLDRAVVEKTLPNLFSTKVARAWKQGAAGPVQQRQRGTVSDSTLKKQDYLAIAKLLDDKFQDGIPLDLPAAQLVQRIREALAQDEPDVNPELLNFMVDQQKQTKV